MKKKMFLPSAGNQFSESTGKNEYVQMKRRDNIVKNMCVCVCIYIYIYIYITEKAGPSGHTV
jgi:hypothetical protein